MAEIATALLAAVVADRVKEEEGKVRIVFEIERVQVLRSTAVTCSKRNSGFADIFPHSFEMLFSLVRRMASGRDDCRSEVL